MQRPLNVLDQPTADAPMSGRRRDDEFAQVATKAKVMRAGVTKDAALIFPDYGQVSCGCNFHIERIRTRQLLPESRF